MYDLSWGGSGGAIACNKSTPNTFSPWIYGSVRAGRTAFGVRMSLRGSKVGGKAVAFALPTQDDDGCDTVATVPSPQQVSGPVADGQALYFTTTTSDWEPASLQKWVLHE